MKLLNPYIACALAGLLSVFAGYGRTVLSESTKEPVIYAGVGVINRNLGTVVYIAYDSIE